MSEEETVIEDNTNQPEATKEVQKDFSEAQASEPSQKKKQNKTQEITEDNSNSGNSSSTNSSEEEKLETKNADNNSSEEKNEDSKVDSKEDSKKEAKKERPKRKRNNRNKKKKENDDSDENPGNHAELLYDDEGSIDYDDSVSWKKSNIATAKEFFNTEILYRFDIIPPEEIAPLKGIYKIDLGEEGQWLLDIDQQIDVNTSSEEPEVTLEIVYSDFLEIVNGHLNPQLALLSKKIKVNGNIDKAIKLQDVLAPRG